MKKFLERIRRAAQRVQEWIDKLRGKEPSKPDSGDAVPFSALRWNRGGENFSGAVRDERVIVKSMSIRAGSPPLLSYAGEGLTIWPPRSENINGIACIFFDADGDGVYERGGKYDWTRSNAAPRPLQHLNHGYKNWDGYPASGTPWAHVITDIHGRRRTNVTSGRWP